MFQRPGASKETDALNKFLQPYQNCSLPELITALNTPEFLAQFNTKAGSGLLLLPAYASASLTKLLARLQPQQLALLLADSKITAILTADDLQLLTTQVDKQTFVLQDIRHKKIDEDHYLEDIIIPANADGTKFITLFPGTSSNATNSFSEIDPALIEDLKRQGYIMIIAGGPAETYDEPDGEQFVTGHERHSAIVNKILATVDEVTGIGPGGITHVPKMTAEVVKDLLGAGILKPGKDDHVHANVMGWSRGSVSAMRYCHLLHDDPYLRHIIDIDRVILYDPVPGMNCTPLDQYNQSTDSYLPDNVKKAMICYSMLENRLGFQPADIVPIPSSSPEIEFYYSPAWHGGMNSGYSIMSQSECDLALPVELRTSRTDDEVINLYTEDQKKALIEEFGMPANLGCLIDELHMRSAQTPYTHWDNEAAQGKILDWCSRAQNVIQAFTDMQASEAEANKISPHGPHSKKDQEILDQYQADKAKFVAAASDIDIQGAFQHQFMAGATKLFVENNDPESPFIKQLVQDNKFSLGMLDQLQQATDCFKQQALKDLGDPTQLTIDPIVHEGLYNSLVVRRLFDMPDYDEVSRRDEATLKRIVDKDASFVLLSWCELVKTVVDKSAELEALKKSGGSEKAQAALKEEIDHMVWGQGIHMRGPLTGMIYSGRCPVREKAVRELFTSVPEFKAEFEKKYSLDMFTPFHKVFNSVVAEHNILLPRGVNTVPTIAQVEKIIQDKPPHSVDTPSMHAYQDSKLSFMEKVGKKIFGT